jgi:hypothetical protein
MVFKQGVGHIVALPFTLKSTLRQKKNYEISNISPCKKCILQKKSSKRNQNPSRYYNFVTNCKFQNKPKYYLSKILYFIKIELLLLLPRGQNPLSYYTL